MSPSYVIELRLKDGSIQYAAGTGWMTENLQHARIAISELSAKALIRGWKKDSALDSSFVNMRGALVRAVPIEIVRIQLTNAPIEV
jgi:hypothetical protein